MDKKAQVIMHKDFFDSTQFAIDNGFFLEAVFREYAAIESRLEVILGLFGLPCNNKAPDQDRRDIKISHRIKCLKRIYSSNTLIGNTKIDPDFFTSLDKWCSNRNTIVHGFYKNELKYKERSLKNKSMAVDGLRLARKLYNEAKRLRRYQLSHPNIDIKKASNCVSKDCKLNKSK